MSRMFTRDHEWLTVEGDVATVGITEYAQSQLGDVVFVELPQVGRQVAKGDTAGVVESVKAASDVFSPLTGEVVEVNSEIVADPALVNKDPMEAGWVFRIRLADRAQRAALLAEAAYKDLVICRAPRTGEHGCRNEDGGRPPNHRFCSKTYWAVGDRRGGHAARCRSILPRRADCADDPRGNMQPH